MKLICFPHAGGFASYYNFIRAYPYSRISQVVLYEYTGRSTRFHEPAATTFDECISLATEEVKRLVDNKEPYALFGHSMGAFVAYEVACRMTDFKRGPKIVFISGQKPLCDVRSEYYTDSPEVALPMIKKLGGMPDYIREHPELCMNFFSLTLSDFKLLSSYRPTVEHKGSKPSVGVFFHGDNDCELKDHDLDRWNDSFEIFLGIHTFHGGHFYLKQYQTEVCQLIERYTKNEDIKYEF